MGKIATTSPVWGCSVSDMRELARITEEAGFDGILSPEVPPYNAITNAQVFAECTERINVGTWIANIYMRQPVVATATALTIQEITDGRMIDRRARVGDAREARAERWSGGSAGYFRKGREP